MTDREKLWKLVKEAIHSWESDVNMSDHIADHLIANGVTFAEDNNVPSKWIPVTERLPEYGQIVLAFGKRHATSGMFRGTTSRPNQWHWKGNTYKEVSHWMPLPEPPKGE